jgi:hypothetical protein
VGATTTMCIDNKILTVGAIAACLEQPIHRVQYLIQSRGLRPVGRAGNLRVFDESALTALRQAAAEADLRSGKEVNSNAQ